MSPRRVALVVTIVVLAAAAQAAAAPGVGVIGAPGLEDPFFPLAGNGGYDVSHLRAFFRTWLDTPGQVPTTAAAAAPARQAAAQARPAAPHRRR
jgi:hypothetical protein